MVAEELPHLAGVSMGQILERVLPISYLEKFSACTFCIEIVHRTDAMFHVGNKRRSLVLF